MRTELGAGEKGYGWMSGSEAKKVLLWLCVLTSIWLSGCGSGGTSATQPASKIIPTVTVTPNAKNILTTQPLVVTITVSGNGSASMPTGSVSLSGGGYTSRATALSGGTAQINIPTNSLTAGSDTLTATYTPDTASSSLYASATGAGSVTVTATTSVTYTLTVNSTTPSSGITIAASPADNNSQSGGTTPFTLTYNAGTVVTLSAAQTNNTYTFASWSGCTSANGTTCSATMNANIQVTVTYSQTGITSITVSPNSATIGKQQQFSAVVSGTGNYSSGVTWSVAAPSGSSLSPGEISSSGLYTTPFPAPPTVIVTATSIEDPSVSGTTTVSLDAPVAAAGPSLSVDVNTPNMPSENPHMISHYIYGMNAYDLDSASATIANPSILRWGGNGTSRYNYQNNMTNSANNNYFQNKSGLGDFPTPSGGTIFTQFVQSTDALGVTALGTVPVIGWVSNSTLNACSFPESTTPGQQAYNSNGCGNGVYLDGYGGCTSSSGCKIYGNDTVAAITSIREVPPSITSTSTPAPGSSASTLRTWADGTWAGSWVNSMMTNPNMGNGASGKGVAIWDLDNEPEYWSGVHRDVHPNPFTYDELTNNDIGTALAIKSADPTALVSGPVISNWWTFFYSELDVQNGYHQGPCYRPWSDPTDREAHGGVPMIEYYLQQFSKYSQEYGIRLLDYMNIHGYFAPSYSGASVGLTTAGDTQEQETRMNGTRVFWDPTYTDPAQPQPNYITDSNYTTSCSPPLQAPELIPMMQHWVQTDYPGTKTSIDEYNFGGLESINGAVVEADILGIFGRQGLDMAAFWPTTAYNQQGPGNYAFAMYRNYDLANDGATFGDTYLYAKSTASGGDGEGQLAVYAAQRSKDNAITVMVVNKTYGSLTSTITLDHFTAASGTNAQVYQYSGANLNTIVQQAAVSVVPSGSNGTASTINYTFPAQSITLFVVPN